ncbi:MAG: YqzL family protein [Firmicutes bacterium]|nr:YqzL family protein [Bacillota bacterium]
MTRKMLWDLFTHTGKIEYYIKYKELENEANRSRKKV